MSIFLRELKNVFYIANSQVPLLKHLNKSELFCIEQAFVGKL
jgi:hypothetical protein